MNGVAWTGGSSGSIDLRKFWPNGYDEIEALVEHNSYLIIFGKNSTLIFQGADSPSTMFLFDIISNIGCVARDTVQKTGKDIIYYSNSGLRTLGRTIQENSSPIGDASKNVNDEIKSVFEAETGRIRGHYNQDEGFYVISFQSREIAYVFDTRYPLEDFSLRTTTWATLVPLAMTRTAAGAFYIGNANGIEVYEGFLDSAANTYDLDWLTHPMSFGAAANLKFLKDINVTMEGGSGYTPVVRWAWDYSALFSTATIDVPASADVAEYNEAEYNIAEYSTSITINSESTPGGGSGVVLTTGLTATINDIEFAIQQYNIQATIGRVI